MRQNFHNEAHTQFETSAVPPYFLQEIQAVTYQDILVQVFNASTPGTIEYARLVQNSKEVAFKLNTSSEYFGLLVASQALAWKDNVLEGYLVGTDVTKDSFFQRDKF